MIKELFLAIILGSLLGFGFTGGYLALKKNSNFIAPKITANATPTISNPSNKNGPTPTTSINTGDHQITISSPENESIITSSTVTLKGRTSAQSHLIINTPLKSYFITADNAGNFNLDIEIDSGPNLIQIDSFDAEDNTASAQMLITYSTAKI